jgi:hypothetical protein
MSSNAIDKSYWKIDWGRQGGVIFAYLIVFIGYYGIVVNIVMLEDMTSLFRQEWISYTEMNRTILFWTFYYYLDCYYLPVILLFLICLFLTFREDIPHYGIKASIWLVPVIVFEGFFFYYIMFGFSLEPLILQFGYIQGYLNIIFLLTVNLSGAFVGMKLKQYFRSKKKIMHDIKK